MGADVAPVDAYWHMVIDDIQTACDAFAPLYESSDAVDGYVSVEVAQSCLATRPELCLRHVNCMSVWIVPTS